MRDPEGYFGDSNNPQPMVETANDKSAETVIAFCRISPPEEVSNSFTGEYMPVYSLKWQCGRKSIFRSVLLEPIKIYGHILSKNHKQSVIKYPMVWITGNGGGKWYNYNDTHAFMKETNDARLILIDSTTEPLYFYIFESLSFSKEGARAEIRNSKNISIFGVKIECNSTFLYVYNSDNIRIFGHGVLEQEHKGFNLSF